MKRVDARFRSVLGFVWAKLRLPDWLGVIALTGQRIGWDR